VVTEAGALVQPQTLYAATSQASASALISQQLDEWLRDAVRQAIGTVSDDLAAAVLTALAALHWPPVIGQTVGAVAATVLVQAGADPRVAAEAAATRTRVMVSAGEPVASALGIEEPLVDNPATHTIVTMGLVAAFAGLAGLDTSAAQLVGEHSEALLASPEATLDSLVIQGSITEAQRGSLASVIELAKLTDDNLVLIQELLAHGVSSPVQLVSWTAEQWQELIDSGQIPCPPGETPSSYAETILAGLEETFPAHALASHAGDRHLSTLLAQNPDLDVETLNPTRDPTELDWTGIPSADQPQALADLGSYQRLLTLADSTADRIALKRAGYDSALTISELPEEQFLATSGLDEGTARMVYARAHDAASSVAHHHAGLRHVVKHGFSDMPVGNSGPLRDALLRIEGLEALFGSQDYCDCDDSHSVLSPAAYFVDLMHFVDTHVSKPVFVDRGLSDHPLHLRRRRPDLWGLELSPENTNTLIPYLDVVDGVIEHYLNEDGGEGIYQRLAGPDLKMSFRTPCSLPFGELGVYLDHFKLKLANLYRTLGLPLSQIRRATLGLSPPDATVITSPDPAGVTERLGGRRLGDLEVQAFVDATGLERDQLDALLASRYHPDLGAIKLERRSEPGQFQNVPERLVNLTPARLDVIFRFVRLWRSTPWQVLELDMLLVAGREAQMTARDFDDRTIDLLARLSDLQASLALDPLELCALIDSLPESSGLTHEQVQAEPHLYERVFDVKRLFPDPDRSRFHHGALNTREASDRRIDSRLSLVVAGLGISDADLQTLLGVLATQLELSPEGDFLLDRGRLSLLYRHARLAAGLGLSIADFASILQLLFDPAEQALTTLDQIEQLVAFVTWLKGSPFTIAQLRFILGGVADATVSFSTTPATVAALVQKAQAAGAPDPRDALRTDLAASLDVSLARLTNLLAWISSDIEGPGVAAALATGFDANGIPTSPGDLGPLIDLGQQLERVALLFSTLAISDQDLAYLTAQPATMGISSLSALTLPGLQAVALYSTLTPPSSPLTGDIDSSAVVQSALSGPAGTAAQNNRALGRLWGVDPILLDSLPGVLPPAPTPITALGQLRAAAELCTTLGVHAFSLQELGRDGSFTELSRAADIVTSAVAAKYKDVDQRNKALSPLQERVNVMKRDALCDYVIARHAELGFTSHSDLYDFFLLDPDMGGCFETSWVVCAISSVQLYAQRCMQDLEQTESGGRDHVAAVHVAPERIPADEWEWRKNFRVWQANRTVFLYPESYIDPALLDIKTPLFEALENALLQQEITMDTATDAYQTYLTQFAELARLEIGGSCYDSGTDTYYFLGHTHQDPASYYWRTWDGTTWSPWQSISVAIEAATVSPVIYLGSLYVFWVDVKTQDKTTFSNGGSQLEYCEVTITLKYSMLKPDGKWLPPQRLDALRPRLVSTGASPSSSSSSSQTDPSPPPGMMWNNRLPGTNADAIAAAMELSKTYDRVYPRVVGDSLILRYLNEYMPMPVLWDRELDVFRNRLRKSRARIPSLPKAPSVRLYPTLSAARLGLATSSFANEPLFDMALDYSMHPRLYLSEAFVYNWLGDDEQGPERLLNLVHNRYPESVLSIDGQRYLVHDPPGLDVRVKHHSRREVHGAPEPPEQLNGGGDSRGAHPRAGHALRPHEQLARVRHATSIARRADHHAPSEHRQLIRLSTTNADDLGEVFVRQGLEQFFALETQRLHEHPVAVKLTARSELLAPLDDPRHLDFDGPMGNYYCELYVHAPWLIGRSLRANGQYDDAIWWFRRIYDSTASASPHDARPTDRVWRYIGFRDLTVPDLQAMLTNRAAIAAYDNDPFEPHAIARLRPTAYQRAIVMDTAKTHLDHADDLFRTFTMESVTEAGMLYNLVSEQLGRHPVSLGECQTVTDTELSYEKVGSAERTGSEFLLLLENWTYANHHAARHRPSHAQQSRRSVRHYTAVAHDRRRRRELTDALRHGDAHHVRKRRPATTDLHGSLVFCVPPNSALLALYDLVDDRLYKIRNCMNIDGVREQLALFAPPLDVMALVRAKAAGISLDDAVATLDVPLPPYRFTYMIQQARQAAQMVESIESPFLSALEKKDNEELTLLRSVHERTILQMTTAVKTSQVSEAQQQLQAVTAQLANVQNRIDYYTGLIADGLTAWETTEEVSRQVASGLRLAEIPLHLSSAIEYLIPQIGSPFAMKYGGKEIGDAGSAWANWVGSMAGVFEAVAAAAGMEGTWQRRSDEWQYQLVLAQQEYAQVQAQLDAAQTRADMAQKELDIHNTSLTQAGEIDQFLKTKFTSLGLYNYLATTLTGLHRDGYHVAQGLAQRAQRAYAFERDDNTQFIANNNWEPGKAGLLAGQKLSLQLEQLEAAYVQNNTRQLEVSQSLSLMRLDPRALLNLKESGTCEFSVPELLLDLAYPGQYKRVIRSARLSIPAVVGPYTSVSANLTLTSSQVRTKPTTDGAALVTLPPPPASSIATSSAINDAGLHEFSFSDGRYLPFEGGGAVSSWRLELPDQLRTFDYTTIPDVILHLSYTALDDDGFRTTVETGIVNALTSYAATNGLYRLFSLRHDFPDAFYQLLHPVGSSQATTITLDQRHFPYFLQSRTLTAAGATVFVEPTGPAPIDTTGLTISVGGVAGGPWSTPANTNLRAADVALSGPAQASWAVDVNQGRLDPTTVGDVAVLLKYLVV